MTEPKDEAPAAAGQGAATIPLSEFVFQQVVAVFAAEHVDEAAAQLLGVTSMGLDQAELHHIDRFRLAALKQSQGDLSRLHAAVALFRTDPRDLLMQAGFGADPGAHLNWKPLE